MRFLLFVILLFVALSPATAQVNFGFYATYGTSDIRYDDELVNPADELDAASSLSFGAVLMADLSDVFSLRSGVNINRRGTTILPSGPDIIFGATVPGGAEAKTRFTYVDVPVLAQLHLPLGGKLSPYLFAGPTFGYATTGNVRVTADDMTGFNLMTSEIELDAIDYDRFHVAATGGIGLRLRLSEVFSTFLEGRYEQSFSEPYTSESLRGNAGYRSTRFGAGFAFAL